MKQWIVGESGRVDGEDIVIVLGVNHDDNVLSVLNGHLVQMIETERLVPLNTEEIVIFNRVLHEMVLGQ